MSESLTFSQETFRFPVSVADHATLEALIRSYYAVLCRFAETFLPDASLAKDVVQESFIKVWKSGKTFESQQSLKGFLYTVTRNGCLDLLRSRTRLDNRHQHISTNHEESVEPVLTEIIRAESIAPVYQYIRSMPEKMQHIVLLSFRDGMTVSEIAKHLGMNLKAVKKQKYKALVALRGRFNAGDQPLIVLITAAALMGDRLLK